MEDWKNLVCLMQRKEERAVLKYLRNCLQDEGNPLFSMFIEVLHYTLGELTNSLP